MKEANKGTQVLIKATIVRRCPDERPEDERGYVVKTSRGEVMIEPQDIFEPNLEEQAMQKIQKVGCAITIVGLLFLMLALLGTCALAVI